MRISSESRIGVEHPSVRRLLIRSLGSRHRRITRKLRRIAGSATRILILPKDGCPLGCTIAKTCEPSSHENQKKHALRYPTPQQKQLCPVWYVFTRVCVGAIVLWAGVIKTRQDKTCQFVTFRPSFELRRVFCIYHSRFEIVHLCHLCDLRAFLSPSS